MFPCLVLMFVVWIPRPALEATEPESVIGLGWLQLAELSPGASLLATSSDSMLHVWHRDGAPAWVYHSPDGLFFLGSAWSPHGTLIALVNALGHVSILNVSDPSQAVVLTRPTKAPGLNPWDDCFSWREAAWGFQPYPLSWSPDGRELALGWCGGAVHLFNVAERRYETRLSIDASIECVDWSPDGRLILAGGLSRVLVLNRSTGRVVLNLSSNPTSGLSAFSPDGEMIACWRARSLDIHGITDGTLIATGEIGGGVTAMSWSPDGSTIAVGTVDGRILLWALETGSVISNISAHSCRILSLSWEGSLLASASSDQTVKLWAILPPGAITLVRKLSGWGSRVNSLSWYPDGERMAATHDGRFDPIRVYGIDGTEQLRISAPEDVGSLMSSAVSPDGKMIAAISSQFEITVWDGLHGTLACRLETSEPAFCVEWCPSNTRAVAIGGVNGVEIRDVLDGRLLSSFGGVWYEPGEIPIDRFVITMAWSSDGEMLAVGFPSAIEVWDPWRPALIVSKSDWRLISSLTWSPDGSRIGYISSYDKEYDNLSALPSSCRALWQIAKLTVWGVRKVTAEQIDLTHLGDLPLPVGRSSLGKRLDWSPNSSMLAIGVGSQEYSLGMGAELAKCFGGYCRPGVVVCLVGDSGIFPVANLTGIVRCSPSVGWSPDGSRIAAGCDDGTVWLWRVGPATPISEAASVYLLLLVVVLASPMRADLRSNILVPACDKAV